MSVHVAWMTEAACVGQPELFFTNKTGNGSRIAAEAAQRVCETCPVVKDCREYSKRERFGVWAGKLKSARTLKGLKPINHGSYGGYKAHHRRKDFPVCDACTQAHRVYTNTWAAKQKTA